MIEELKQRIKMLEIKLANLENANDNIDIDGYLNNSFLLTDKPNLPSESYTSDAGFRRTISLSGDPESIIVPAYPYRFVRMKDYPNFYIPVHTFNQLAT